MEIVKILDTTIADTGPTQTIDDRFLRLNQPLRVHCDLAAGDVIKIYVRPSSAHDWDELYEFTDETPIDIYPSKEVKAERTLDGGAGDSSIYIQSPFIEVDLTEHTA